MATDIQEIAAEAVESSGLGLSGDEYVEACAAAQRAADDALESGESTALAYLAARKAVS